MHTSDATSVSVASLDSFGNPPLPRGHSSGLLSRFSSNSALHEAPSQVPSPHARQYLPPTDKSLSRFPTVSSMASEAEVPHNINNPNSGNGGVVKTRVANDHDASTQSSSQANLYSSVLRRSSPERTDNTEKKGKEDAIDAEAAGEAHTAHRASGTSTTTTSSTVKTVATSSTLSSVTAASTSTSTAKTATTTTTMQSFDTLIKAATAANASTSVGVPSPLLPPPSCASVPAATPPVPSPLRRTHSAFVARDSTAPSPSLSVSGRPMQRQATEADFTTMVSDTTMSTSSAQNRCVDDTRDASGYGAISISNNTNNNNNGNNGSGGRQATKEKASSGTSLLGPSEALTLYPGPPPPSGLRDPVTLLQLLPIDLLLHPPADPSAPHTARGGGNNGVAGTLTAQDGKRRESPATSMMRGGSGNTDVTSDDYRRAFSLLRCAIAPFSALSRSPNWQQWGNTRADIQEDHHNHHHRGKNKVSVDTVGASTTTATTILHATLGRVMSELDHRNQSIASPALHLEHPAPYLSSRHNGGNSSPHMSSSGHRYPQHPSQLNRKAGSSTTNIGSGSGSGVAARAAAATGSPSSSSVLLCSLAADMGCASPPLPSESTAPHFPPAGSEVARDDEQLTAPLIFFAAVVECPPDIRRFLLLSRTHAYLCDADGTVAYCVAVCDVRQIVACAGGYMVWRFVADALVLTMLKRFQTDEERRATPTTAAAGGVAAVSGRGDKSKTMTHASSDSELVRGAGVFPSRSRGGAGASPGSPLPAGSASPTAAAAASARHENRDEMSDWVFRILSVGDTRTSGFNAAGGGNGGGGAAAPVSFGSATDLCDFGASSLTGSPRDDGSGESRTQAMVFLLNAMCVLRTLPRLVMDTIVSGSTATAATTTTGGSGETGMENAMIRRRTTTTTSSSSPLSASAPVNAAGAATSRGRVGDRLDKMHVAGDRPARVPLLLEGPVGFQTAVKFVEQYWTTRYDQLPPLLRPRSIQAAVPPADMAGPVSATTYCSGKRTTSQTSRVAPSALEGGGAGAHVCYVDSSLSLPLIPVVSLEAALSAEEGMTNMAQTVQEALRGVASVSPAPSSNSPATAQEDPQKKRRTSSAPFLSAAAEQAAQSSLSPAALRIFQRLLKGDDSSFDAHNNFPERDARSAEDSMWGCDHAPMTPLNTPVTPNAAHTRAHSAESNTRSSSEENHEASPLAASAVAETRSSSSVGGDGGRDREGLGMTAVLSGEAQLGSSSDRGVDADTGKTSSALASRSSNNSAASTVDDRAAEGQNTGAAGVQSDDSKTADTKTRRKKTVIAVRSLLRTSAANTTAVAVSANSGSCSSSLSNSIVSSSSHRVPAAKSARHTSSLSSSSSHTRNSGDRRSSNPQQDTHPLQLDDASTRQHGTRSSSSSSSSSSTSVRSSQSISSPNGDFASSKRAAVNETPGACSVAGIQPSSDVVQAEAAITTQRLRRPRTALQDASNLEEEKQHCPAASEKVGCEVKTTASTMIRSGLPVSKLSPTVTAFEQRIRHRPPRDRRVLRGRYIEQLLRTPLRTRDGHDSLLYRSSGTALTATSQDFLQRRAVDSTGTMMTTEGYRPALADPDELIDDVRRQRVIAELMCIQKAESDTASKPADTGHRTHASAHAADDRSKHLSGLPHSVPPPLGGIDTERWRTLLLEERMQRNLLPGSEFET